jgi:hypothetical protein
MGEQTNTVTDDETPNATVSSTVETTTIPEPSGETPDTSNNETLQAEIKRLSDSLKRANGEAKTNRLAAEELKSLKDQLEASKLSETEKLQKQLATLQSERDTLLQRHQEQAEMAELERTGRKAGITDEIALADAIKLLDRTQLEHDENGKPTNAEDAFRQLVKTRPWLAGKTATPTSGGATNPARSQSSAPPVLSWEAISQMKPEEYRTRRAEIQQWMSNNPTPR